MRRPRRKVEALECVVVKVERSPLESPYDKAITVPVDAFVKSSVPLGNTVSFFLYSVIRRSASVRRSFGQRKVVYGFVPYVEYSCEALLGVTDDFLTKDINLSYLKDIIFR